MDVRTVRRSLGRIRSRLRDEGLRRGLVRYRTGPWTGAEWTTGYESGHLDYFARIDELARYSLIVGYLAHLGGEPEVLDVGCGQGLLRARLGTIPFTRYVGVDPTAVAIERARAHADDRTSFLVGAIGDPDLDLGRFHVVVCNEVLSVAEDPDLFLDRIRDHLRPGGHLLCSTWRHPGDQQLAARLDARFERVDEVFAWNPANPIAPRGWWVSCHRGRG